MDYRNMKGKKAMTNTERQRSYRENLALKNGARLSITISQEAATALQVIRNQLELQDVAHTKRAAIETALKHFALFIDCTPD